MEIQSPAAPGRPPTRSSPSVLWSVTPLDSPTKALAPKLRETCTRSKACIDPPCSKAISFSLLFVGISAGAYSLIQLNFKKIQKEKPLRPNLKVIRVKNHIISFLCLLIPLSLFNTVGHRRPNNLSRLWRIVLRQPRLSLNPPSRLSASGALGLVSSFRPRVSFVKLVLIYISETQ